MSLRSQMVNKNNPAKSKHHRSKSDCYSPTKKHPKLPRTLFFSSSKFPVTNLEISADGRKPPPFYKVKSENIVSAMKMCKDIVPVNKDKKQRIVCSNHSIARKYSQKIEGSLDFNGSYTYSNELFHRQQRIRANSNIDKSVQSEIPIPLTTVNQLISIHKKKEIENKKMMVSMTRSQSPQKFESSNGKYYLKFPYPIFNKRRNTLIFK